MPSNSNADDLNQKSFRLMKQDDEKFFTRLLSKESSKANPSFRVYYGDVSSAVPFTWETRPGTPKHSSFCEMNSYNIPPLTPPPSYYSTNLNNSSKKNYSRSKLLLHTLLRRMNPKKSNFKSSPSNYSSSSLSSSLSWSSSSRSSFSDPIVSKQTYGHRRRHSSFDDRSVLDDGVCPSSLCFGIGKENREGSYSALFVKKALLSIVGRGSA